MDLFDMTKVVKHSLIPQCLPNTTPEQKVEGYSHIQGYRHPHLTLGPPPDCFLRQDFHPRHKLYGGASMLKPELAVVQAQLSVRRGAIFVETVYLPSLASLWALRGWRGRTTSRFPEQD